MCQQSFSRDDVIDDVKVVIRLMTFDIVYGKSSSVCSEKKFNKKRSWCKPIIRRDMKYPRQLSNHQFN